MEREAIKVLSGAEYDHLFPRALLTTIVKKQGATVADTIKLIPQIVQETTWQATKLAAELKADTLEETCRNIWEFVYKHIAYKKDENGKEQVRSFARTWHDRGNFQKDKNGNFLKDRYGGKVPGGVDCDCGTTFISTLLSAMQIKHALRIVKFADSFGITNPNYSHIYPIVPKPSGGYYTIDFVVHKFNYEEPFREKHDTKMDLEYLNGVYSSQLKNAEAIELAGAYEDSLDFSGLGKLFKHQSGPGNGSPGKLKLKDVLKKGGLKKLEVKALNFTNKLNPAVIPLRLGLLAAMKTNFMKIGSRLKYAYLSDAEAKKRGVDNGKFEHLKKIKDKLESIFYQAGGMPGAIKEAVLKGHGNKHRDVLAGLGYAPENLMAMNERTPLSKLLGQSYYDEVSGFEGLGALGEPATAATITAATGVLAAIAGLLKQVGNIFPKKSKESKDFEEGAANGNGADTTSTSSGQDTTEFNNSGEVVTNPGDTTSTGNGEGGANQTTDVGNSNKEDEGQNNLPATTEGNQQTGLMQKRSNLNSTNANGSETFWQKNKSWLLPTSIGVGVIAVSVGGYMVFKKPKAENKKPAKAPALAGVPRSKKKKKKGGGKPKIESKKKQVVAFI